MESTLIALKLLLDGLEIPTSVRSLADRKTVQKAVYLGQRAGVDLGYRFGWYLMGPYSPDLARDYYALDTAIQAGERDFEAHTLLPSAQELLGPVRAIFVPPAKDGPSQPDWLELLASLDYLMTVSGFDYRQAQDEIRQEKPRLAPWLEAAQGALERAHLFSG